MVEEQIEDNDPTTRTSPGLTTPVAPYIRSWLRRVASVDDLSLPTASTVGPSQLHPNTPQRRKTVDFSRKWKLPKSSIEEMHEFERFGKTLSEKTVLNIASIATVM